MNLIRNILTILTSPFKKSTNIGVDFDSVDIKEIHERILRDGYCLLRNALPKDSVLYYKNKVDEFYSSIAKRLEAGEKISDYDRVNIRDAQFTEKYGEENSFFNILGNPKFTLLMDSIFGAEHYKPVLPESCTRSIHVSDVNRDKTSFSPLAVHFDGIYHETWPYFSINFWIPFNNCGAGTDFPGLMIYPAGFQDIRQSIDANTPEDFKKIISSDENPDPMKPLQILLDKMFKQKNIKPIKPHFDIGDIMLINSWTPHGTYWDGKMSSCRRSLEIRFHGDSWNPLEIENSTKI